MKITCTPIRVLHCGPLQGSTSPNFTSHASEIRTGCGSILVNIHAYIPDADKDAAAMGGHNDKVESVIKATIQITLSDDMMALLKQIKSYAEQTDTGGFIVRDQQIFIDLVEMVEKIENL